MKISTKGRYAVRLMLDLAQHNSGDTIKLNKIAERQGISEKYLEAIIAMLKKANLVTSIRGTNGGYVLTRKPNQYTVGEILYVTEGDMAPVECLCENADKCDRESSCTTIRIWKELYEAQKGVLYKYTLEMLVDMAKSNNADIDFII